MSRPPVATPAQRGSDLSVAQRLALGFVFALLPVALLAVLTLYEHARIDRQQDQVDQVLRPSAAASLDAQIAYLRQGIALRAFVLTGDDARLTEFQRAEEQAGAALRQLERLPLPEPDRQTLAALTAAAGRYDDTARGFTALVRQGTDDATRRAPSPLCP